MSEADRERLRKLAELNRRTMSAELSMLIEKEYYEVIQKGGKSCKHKWVIENQENGVERYICVNCGMDWDDQDITAEQAAAEAEHQKHI